MITRRITGKTSLLELVGVLKDDEVSELKHNIKNIRKRLRSRVQSVAGKI